MPHPSPPPFLGQLLDIAYLVSAGGQALANLALPRGRAFAIPGTTPPPPPSRAIGSYVHPYTNITLNVENFTGNTSRFEDWFTCLGREKLACLSSLLHELSTWIDTFFLLFMEWNFCWSRIWINLGMVIFLILAMIMYHLRNFIYFFILFNYSEQRTFNTVHYQWTI